MLFQYLWTPAQPQDIQAQEVPSGAESEAEESGLNQESDESEEEGQERVGGNPLGQVPDSQPLLGDVDMLEESLALFETPKKNMVSAPSPVGAAVMIEIPDTPFKVEKQDSPKEAVDDSGVAPIHNTQMVEEAGPGESMEKEDKVDKSWVENKEWREERIAELHRQLADARKKQTSLIFALFGNVFPFQRGGWFFSDLQEKLHTL